MAKQEVGKGVCAMTQQKKFFLAILSALFSLSPAAQGAGFQTAQSYPVGTNLRAVAVGDFNGDGTAGLAICNFGDPTVGDDGNLSLLLGKGTSKFQPANKLYGGKKLYRSRDRRFRQRWPLRLARSSRR
jgi:hypothetical protein